MLELSSIPGRECGPDISVGECGVEANGTITKQDIATGTMFAPHLVSMTKWRIRGVNNPLGMIMSIRAAVASD